jgi:hypothetical protein
VSGVNETLLNNANEESVAKNHPEIAQTLIDSKAELATITELHIYIDPQQICAPQCQLTP